MDQAAVNMGTFSTAAIAAALRPISEDIYGRIKSGLSQYRLKSNADSLRRSLLTRVQWLNEVKTLLCLESPVALTEFYSPQHVQLPEGDRVHLRSLKDISGLQNCIITGTAGQGKSVLFRYLALQEVLEKRLPVFIELRNLSHKSDVWELISDELHALGFDKHEDVLKYLLHDTHTTVFLDAFDEVPPSIQTRTRAEIEELTRLYPETRFLISSRPSLQIESSPFFRVARLSYLRPEEVPAVLKRMCRDTDDPATVESEIKKSNHHLTELLNTPLMVALLLLHYRLSRKFPETEQAFFDDLFDVLLRRHDQTKGYIRKRYSEATESELSDVFGYICFLCRKRGETDVTRRSLVETASAAIEYFQCKLDAAGIVDDVIHGTNLILEEGGGCRFAHKSIQEFYGAAFLVRQPETQVAGFLAGKVTQWDMWAQFLRFTEILDRHKFLEYFLVPHIGHLAYADSKKRIPMGWIPSKKAFERVFWKGFNRRPRWGSPYARLRIYIDMLLAKGHLPCIIVLGSAAASELG
jgi:hypothetical protein